MCAPDTSIGFVAQFENHKICFSTEFTPGKYLYECYSVAIHSSKLIFVFITENLVQHPLFEFQLSLALRCKGPASVILILRRNSSRLKKSAAIKRSFQYALAVCKKIYIEQ